MTTPLQLPDAGTLQGDERVYLVRNPSGIPSDATGTADAIAARALALPGFADAVSSVVGSVAPVVQNIAAAGAVDVQADHVRLTAPASGSYAITLAAPTAGASDWVLIEVVSAPGSGRVTLALTNIVGGPVGGEATFTVVGDALLLRRTDAAWLVANQQGVVLRPPRVEVPSGFTWTPPITVYRSADGVYSTDFNPAAYVVSGKAYYVSTTGNNANDGLTWGTAKRSIQNVLQTVADYDMIYVAAGEYFGTNGWNGQSMTRSASMIAVGGRAVLSRRVTSFTWAPDANPNVHLGTPNTALAIGLVVDARNPGPTGLPARLIRATSLANCEATRGSFWPSGTNVYVHLPDGRAPDADVIGYFTGENARISASVNAYFEGIDFVAGDDAFVTAGTPATRTAVFNDCSFRFASNGDGLDINAGGTYILQNCIAEMNELDGLNYGVSNDGVTGPRMFEIGCVARWNGHLAGGLFNNGSTQHFGGSGVSVNCRYERNQNRNVHDVFTGCQRWALGCTSRNSRDPGTGGVNWAAGQIPGQSGAGQAASMWLDGCATEGSTTSLEINAAATVRTRNMPIGAWVVSNIGTLDTY